MELLTQPSIHSGGIEAVHRGYSKTQLQIKMVRQIFHTMEVTARC